MKKIILSLIILSLLLESCSTCQSRRRAQNKKWYVEVGAKKYLTKKFNSSQSQVAVN